MAAPFDTLKLARRFEAAGLDPKQAGYMADAIADAISNSNLGTKSDLDLAIYSLKVWTGSIGAAIAALLFGALHLWPPH